MQRRSFLTQSWQRQPLVVCPAAARSHRLGIVPAKISAFPRLPAGSWAWPEAISPLQPKQLSQPERSLSKRDH